MRIRTALTIAALATLATGATVGCSIHGNGPWLTKSDLSKDVTTESRDIDGFTGVSVSGSADITVTQAETFSVEVTADSSLQEHIDTKVTDATLHIDQNYSIVGASPVVSVSITMPRLASLSLSGSADATVSGLRGEALDLESSGSSDVRIDGDVSSLTIAISGSGDVTLHGTAHSVDVSTSGSGTVAGSGLTASTAKASVSGSGDISLRVTDALDARVSGSGNVEYYGNPSVTTNTSGSGEVHKAKE